MARYHKTTDYMTLFPIKVGEYAELTVNHEPPPNPEGYLKKAFKKGASAVGLGGGAAQVVSHAVCVRSFS